MAKDPICGMYVEEESAVLKSVKYGRIYYFCSENCKKQFDEPEVEYKRLKFSLILSWSFTIPVILLSYIFSFHYSNFLVLLLASIVQFYPGMKFYRGTLDAFKNKAGNMDTLIAIGTSAAWGYSFFVVFIPSLFPTDALYFNASTAIISLILTGTFMEHLSKERASNALTNLVSLQPKKAHVVINGDMIDKDTEEVKVGDILLVKPAESIPTDSIVVEGNSTVNESMITGESLPVDKKIGDTVIGATINLSGVIKLRAEKVGSDTTLSEIIEVVRNATSERVPIQRLADKVSTYFVPAVVGIGIFSFMLWNFVFKIGITFSLLVFVSVIIIACPCALGIATPAALLVSSGKAAENGILIKSGESIEIANKINAIAFDKTGTLTKGELEVTDVLSFGKLEKKDILKYAAIAESNSEHPIGRSVVKEAEKLNVISEVPEKFNYIPGKGITVKAGQTIQVGNRELYQDQNLNLSRVENKIKSLELEGKTVLIVSVDSEISGLIALQDTLKEDSKKALKAINSLNIDTWLISGDNEIAARAIADELEIKNVMANLKPKQKMERIEELQKQGKIVAMVGDGINDAPALAKANLGIAIGSGTDVAKETGGLVLMKDRLYDVYVALKLGRMTIRKIKQNLMWALFYNAILIPIAAGVLIPFLGPQIYNELPFMAAFAMAFSSTTVVLNSLLLKRFTP